MNVRAGLASLVLVGAALVASGCEQEQACMPEPLHVDPSRAPVGSSVVVSSPAATCDLGYAAGTQYTLALLSVQPVSEDPPETVVEVGSDGAFSVRVPIPAEFPLGPASITVRGSGFDRCAEGHPPGASCVGYQVALTVVA